jgi:hypothetical protein
MRSTWRTLPKNVEFAAGRGLKQSHSMRTKMQANCNHPAIMF